MTLIKNPYNFIARLVQQKKNFIIKAGNYSLTVEVFEGETKIRNQFRQNTLSDAALFLAGSIKARLNKYDKYKMVDKKDIKYFHFYLKKPGVYKNIVEIDVNGAYWSLAYQMGFLTLAQYEKGLILDKKERLIVLGSIATTKKMIVFKNGEKVGERLLFSRAGKAIFYNISDALGNIMHSIVTEIGEEYFYLFWVDAFFCSAVVKERVLEKLEAYGLGGKVFEMQGLTVKRGEKGSVKVFTLEALNHFPTLSTIKIKPFAHNTGESQKETYFNTLKELNILK